MDVSHSHWLSPCVQLSYLQQATRYNSHWPTPTAPSTDPPASAPPAARTSRNVGMPKRFKDFATSYMATIDIPEPSTIYEALSGPDSDKWQQAIDEEMQSIVSNGTYTLQTPPPGTNLVQLKWVFKHKRDGAGNIERYKVRLVAKGFQQRQGIDFDEVYAPVSKHTTFRVFLALAINDDLLIHHLDIKTAFLNGNLQEDVWTTQPPGYESDPTLACKLNKTLYGLKQAPRAWNLRLADVLHSFGLKPSNADPGLYTGHHNGEFVALLTYVDDLLLMAKSLNTIQGIKDALASTFDARDLGLATYFLGMTITWDNDSVLLAQQAATSALVSKFGMSNSAPRSTPLTAGIALTHAGTLLDAAGKAEFQQMVGGMIYLAICTRPDISQAVGVLSRYMAAPTTEHLSAAKGVLRYLNYTKGQGLLYTKQSYHWLLRCRLRGRPRHTPVHNWLCIHDEWCCCQLAEQAPDHCRCVHGRG